MANCISNILLAFIAATLLITGCSSPAADKASNTGDATKQDNPTTIKTLNTPEPLSIVRNVDRQPLVSQTSRLIEAMDFVGSPFSKADVDALNAAMALEDDAQTIESIQRILNTYTLIDVHINPEARVKLAPGQCIATLQQQGWRAFLVRVQNEPRVSARLAVSSKNSQPTMDFGQEGTISTEDVKQRWMKVEMVDKKPLNPRLSGLPVEYRIVTIFSRDAGDREGHIAFNIGHGTQDIGFRNDLHLLFNCKPAVKVIFNIKDADDSPATGSLVIQDPQGQLYPLPARREAPDFFFQEQIYRASGESVMLPAGNYEVVYGRGPEYLREKLNIEVPNTASHPVDLQLTRWIDPEAKGWISGDHHIHAAGCSHYQSPGVGVPPSVMMKHIEGEGLNIGNVLTWGPGWEHQKKHFSGIADAVSTDRHVIRYDVEVSQFPSDHTGHLCLLGLTEDDYPGTTKKTDWPSWGLPIVQWAKKQGAITGVAHSGWGLDVSPEQRVPNYVIPPMNGIGAQEFIVQAAFDAVDFISTVDTPYVWELNVWYHMMNCGFNIKASGETDFPCIYSERVGLGRSYVKIDNTTKLNYPDWVEGVRVGRSYVSDGFSHLMDFTVNEVAPGGAEKSIVNINEPQKVHVTATVAAWLDEQPRMVFLGAVNWDTLVKGEMLSKNREQIPIRDLPYTAKPYWHLERARVDDTRNITVELIVNGLPVDQVEILADGKQVPVSFDVEIERSSWVALRILAASHTNPVMVLVNEQPVRASKLSAHWCLDSIDQVWLEKAMNIRSTERAAAREAYGVAREVYEKIAAESYDDTATLAGADAALRQQQHLDIQENVDVIEFAMAHNDGEFGKVLFDRTIRGFTGQIDLHLTVEPAAATIHYTTDGSRVTPESPAYADAVILDKTMTISARGFIEGKPCTDAVTATYTQFTPEDFGVNVTPGSTQQGLNFRYYHGEYIQLQDVKESALVSEYFTSNFTLGVRERDINYALRFAGLIDIPKDGIYNFETVSNDGSTLTIGDTLVVNNDGQHGIRPISGTIPLKAGLHPIRVDYFNAGGSWGLEVNWKGPTFEKQPIPDAVLHRKTLSELERQR